MHFLPGPKPKPGDVIASRPGLGPRKYENTHIEETDPFLGNTSCII